MRALANILLILLATSGTLYAQLAVTDDLYLVLKQQDSILFHAAFNTCDDAVMTAMFTEDFEFYHDKGGITEGRETFLKQFRENCAGREAGQSQPSKRILFPKSLEVHPLKNNGVLYGAIQHGMHEFEFLNGNGEYQKGDIARFTHLWILEQGKWKVKRELSYDHVSRTDLTN
ncbi:MAG: nuclear transport factor 2 family protein [Bacteroidia bacterium]|nr:nuclear transport factor 2 family protein [Bacteroidia bacterium]